MYCTLRLLPCTSSEIGNMYTGNPISEELWYVSERPLLLHPYYRRRSTQFEYKLYESSRTRTECIRHLGVLIDTKLHFHNRQITFSLRLFRLLGLILTVTLSFSSQHGALTLYRTPFGPQLQYASIPWNFVTSSDACKLERVQLKFLYLCHYAPFFRHLNYSYGKVFNYLKLHTLSARRRQLDVLFFK